MGFYSQIFIVLVTKTFRANETGVSSNFISLKYVLSCAMRGNFH